MYLIFAGDDIIINVGSVCVCDDDVMTTVTMMILMIFPLPHYYYSCLLIKYLFGIDIC